MVNPAQGKFREMFKVIKRHIILVLRAGLIALKLGIFKERVEIGFGGGVDFCDARKQGCCFYQSKRNFVNSAMEISGNMSNNGENSEEDSTMTVEALKAEK